LINYEADIFLLVLNHTTTNLLSKISTGKVL